MRRVRRAGRHLLHPDRRRPPPRHPEQHRSSRKSTAGIGALGDIGCYSLDMVLNAIGYPKPLTVTGYTSELTSARTRCISTPMRSTRRRKMPGALTSTISPRRSSASEGGIVLDFRIAWAMHVDTPGDTILFGKKGALRIPSTECWNGTVGGPMTLYHRRRRCAGRDRRSRSSSRATTCSAACSTRRSAPSWMRSRRASTAPVPSSQILYNQAIIDGIVQVRRAWPRNRDQDPRNLSRNIQNTTRARRNRNSCPLSDFIAAHCRLNLDWRSHCIANSPDSFDNFIHVMALQIRADFAGILVKINRHRHVRHAV